MCVWENIYLLFLSYQCCMSLCWPDQTALHVGLSCWLVSKSGTEGQSHIINANSFIIQTSISACSRWILLTDRWWWCGLPFGQMGWSGWSGFRKYENQVCNHVLPSSFGCFGALFLQECVCKGSYEPQQPRLTPHCCQLVPTAACELSGLNIGETP